MVTGELKNKIDSLWEIFWTGGLTNPLDVIEQMTYLMFIRDIDDSDNLRAKEAAMFGLPFERIFAKEVQVGERRIDGSQLKWSVFHDFPAVKMYSTVQELVFPFIKELHGDKESAYVDNAGINEFETIRERLRDLMKYIPSAKIVYDTNFDDEILSIEWKESELENDDLKNYKAKAEYYVWQHQDNAVIAKLKENIPMTAADVKILEDILWSEIGTKQEYEAEYGEKPLGEFVREIVGLDMCAAKDAFAKYLDETYLDSRQIYFVNQIVEFIVHNGMMKDLSVLQGAPFTDQGSIVEVFTDMSVWMRIRKVIDEINANALAA